MQKSVEERFESKVSRVGECHEWLASRDKNGYGQFSKGYKKWKAHRAAWEMYHEQEVPEGMVVMHSCDNPGCVNPEHLSVGTMADNQTDMARKYRSANIKTSKKDILAIRRESGTLKEVASKYGLGMSTVSRIKREQTHRFVR